MPTWFGIKDTGAISTSLVLHSLKPMAQKDITQKGEEILNQVTSAVEEAGKEVASRVSNLTGQPKEAAEAATKEAIQSAVGQAIEVLQVASDEVREKGINTERVTLKAGVGIPNIAQLEIITDVPSKNEDSRGKGFDVRVS